MRLLSFCAEFCEWPSELQYKDEKGGAVRIDPIGNVFLFVYTLNF